MRAGLGIPSRVLLAAFLCAAPIGAGAIPIGATAPAESPLRAAFNQVAQGKLDAAEKAFLAFKAKDPKIPDSYLGLSYVSIQRRDLAAALRHLNDGMAVAPSNSRLYLTRGRVEALQGKSDIAAADFEKAIALDRTNAEPLLALGDLYLGPNKQPQKALGYYNRATVLDSKNPAGYFGAGMALASARQDQPAIAAFKKAETLFPGSPAPAIGVARIYAKQNRFLDAQGLLDLVIKKFPKSYEALMLHGAVSRALGQQDKAISAYNASLAIQPKSLQALLELAVSARAAGKLAVAESAYKRALAIAPQSPLVLNSYAWMLANVPTRLDQALSMSSKAVAIAPQEPAFHDTLGFVMMKRGNAEGARAEFQKAIALDPKSDAKAHLAELQKAEKVIAGKQSRRYWEAACTIAACLVLAIPAAHAQAKNPAAAQSQPAAADSALTSKIMADAEAALKQGNTRLALIHLRNAVQAAPADAAIRMRLGVILFQSGNTAAAEHELRQARQYGAPAELVLPVLFQSMISRGEFQLILDQFPDPAASTQPAAADIFAARALALRHLGRLPEAIDAMERSLKVRRDARGLLSRARLALQEGQVTPALALADEAVAKFPREPEPLVFKSQLLLNSGNSAAALKVADELGARFPDSRTARLARVELFLGTQNDAKADAEIRAILAKNSRDGMATYYSALLRARKQDIKGAWAIAQTVPTALFDDWPNMGILVAQMAERAGRLETSASILSRILSKNPDLLEIRLKLADIRIQQNSSEFALRILTPVKNSTDPQVLKRLKQVYYDLDRRDDEAAIDKKIKQGTQISGPSALASSQVIRTDAVIANLGGIAERDSTNPAYVVPYIKALIQMKRFDRALAAAERLGAAAPQRSNAQVYRGNVFLAQGKPADALVAFNQAVAVDSRNVMALTARAGFFTTQKRLPEARRDLAAILAIDPKDEGALLRSAEISSLLGEDQAVRETLLRAISFRPNSEAPRLALLRYLVTKKDFSQAIVQADAFVATHPNSSDGLALLGQAQAALGRKKEAVATFRRLIGVKPNEAVPQVLLASALVSTGNNDAAWGALEAAMKLDPKSGSTRAAAIGLQLSQGKNDRAMSIAREFRRSNPGPGADILLADTMVKVGQVKDADTILSKSFADYPNNATLLSLMKFSFLSNDPKRADRLGAKWLADHPGDGHVRLQYAMALMQTGQNANAISQYETVLKAEPQNTIAMNNLGWLLQTSDPKRAVSLLSLAWKLSPDSAEIADTLGWIKLHQNDARGALELLNKAHALRPQEGEITYHLALALDANGKRDEARKLLDGLLASGVAFQGRSAAHTLSAGWR